MKDTRRYQTLTLHLPVCMKAMSQIIWSSHVFARWNTSHFRFLETSGCFRKTRPQLDRSPYRQHCTRDRFQRPQFKHSLRYFLKIIYKSDFGVWSNQPMKNTGKEPTSSEPCALAALAVNSGSRGLGSGNSRRWRWRFMIFHEEMHMNCLSSFWFVESSMLGVWILDRNRTKHQVALCKIAQNHPTKTQINFQ